MHQARRCFAPMVAYGRSASLPDDAELDILLFGFLVVFFGVEIQVFRSAKGSPALLDEASDALVGLGLMVFHISTPSSVVTVDLEDVRGRRPETYVLRPLLLQARTMHKFSYQDYRWVITISPSPCRRFGYCITQTVRQTPGNWVSDFIPGSIADGLPKLESGGAGPYDSLFMMCSMRVERAAGSSLAARALRISVIS